MYVLPSLVVVDIVVKTKKKKNQKKSGSIATVQNWTPLCRRTREVCDFLNTSSGHAISTHNQPNLDSTRDQPSFFRLKFWAQEVSHIERNGIKQLIQALA
jgi:hypothetical protein